jgi:hypothetical protein
MNWMPFVSVAADLGDFIGGIAIVVTLVLLLRQMRQTERITRAQPGHAFSADINAVNLLVAGDQSVPDILRRVAEGEEVTSAEWTRYTFVQLSACHAWEALHAHYRLGLVDAEFWQVQQDSIAHPLPPIQRGVVGGGASLFRSRQSSVHSLTSLSADVRRTVRSRTCRHFTLAKWIGRSKGV